MEKERLLVISEWLRVRRFFNAKSWDARMIIVSVQKRKGGILGMHERDEL